MAVVTLDHITYHRVGDEHRGHGIDVHGPVDLIHAVLVEGPVAGDDSGTLDEHIHKAAFLLHEGIAALHAIVVGNIDTIAVHLAVS